ncbi:tRNA (adenosine(37)-N6)-dimethylallyltransferase MiaA [Variovorax sp. PCZ-1]|uniref:tRNA (adenosine(37)-N6)-dimethylallyltransferase MiaA n=1 Tax=Variovorax sp. PCZ-1 TaxID=2835533 RepID=UPI001BCBE29D|nr:tRNA (adenosine(37)-N6)-dimethylallyltransferase MiaA [Variovorax sp. PCZ-1]MBS7808167.1 tRNA (adenosine(37)-N6)-dimethylallyltransferase MiaA [Variovorax sp. PCZ-1]
MASSAKPKAICIAGPTASGKSALSMQVAQDIPCEIISVDSALVYRGMDIGTAKPSREEQALVPHHLIDILDPTQSYSAAQFVQDATRLIAEINARGKLALLVGGTMLYFKALIEGMDAMPAATPEIRAQIDEEAARLGWPAMHAQLALVDAITAARLSPNDSQRIQRALEVYRASGQPLSFYHQKNDQNRQFAGIESAQSAIDSIANTPIISLQPTSRAWLHERISQRFEQMLQAGLVQEVRQLKARADLHLDLPSMRCVGYRQTWDMLDGLSSEAEFKEKGIAATRQLAKRQITWQRAMQPPAFNKHVIAADSPTAVQDALVLIESWL